jgi:uncharacterized membrane-anchored protein
MHKQHVPVVTSTYWIALICASIFGANTGDFFSDVLGLGHINGLPLLFVVFVLVLICERFDKAPHHAYYWIAIIVARTSATNIGDIFHDFNISFLVAIPSLSIALLGILLAWRYWPNNSVSVSYKNSSGVLQTNAFYWGSMLLAGTLGTVVGDYFSYPLKLGNLYATFVLGGALAAMFLFWRNGKLTTLFYFWATVVMIRSAGTAAGDYFANHVFGLSLSTLITGAIFILFLIFNRNKMVSPA